VRTRSPFSVVCYGDSTSAPHQLHALSALVYRRDDDFAGGDLAVAVGVAGEAGGARRVAEGDVHHRQDLIHRQAIIEAAYTTGSITASPSARAAAFSRGSADTSLICSPALASRSRRDSTTAS